MSLSLLYHLQTACWTCRRPDPQTSGQTLASIVRSSECLREPPTIEKPDLGICTRAKHAGSLFLADATYPTPVSAQCPVSLIA